jgi:light-regulated signal transduction histidine kinase (bacteriophytochrome)
MRFERRIGEQFFIVLLAKFNDGVVGSFYNITDLKATEEKLNLKIQELQNINLELEQFAYVTGHDLQEPLRKINMFADMVLKSSLPGDHNHFHLSSIIRNVRRMDKLIAKLSEYTRLAANQSMFRRVDLNQTIRDLLRPYDEMMTQCNIVLTYDPLPEVWGIPVQIHTLFDNLIGNAIKFSRSGEQCVIHINNCIAPQENVSANPNLNPKLQYTEIIFQDNGSGFDQKHAEKIFRIFQQLEKSAGDDVGIGLSVCLKIVRGHNGDMFAVSTTGEGSRFHIFLPLSAD